jgi:nucleoside-diphosphate-sugar epimerase
MSVTGVTGGAGFLGSHLIDALVAKGARVRVLETFADTPGRSVDRRRRHLERLDRLELVEGDTADPAVADRFLLGVDRVYHFARTPGTAPWITDTDRVRAAELASFEGLLDGMVRHQVQHLVLRSDAGVYGEHRQAGPSTPFAPMSRRAAHQVHLEALAEAWNGFGGRQLTILRPFEIYGPRMGSDHLVHRFLLAARDERALTLPGDGGVVRDLVFAGDFVRVALQARRARTSGGSARFVVASGHGTSLLDLVAAVRRVTGVALRVDVGPASRNEPMVHIGDPAHTESELHVVCDTPLDAGLATTWEWLLRRR